MAAGLHGSARRTPRVRAEIQASQETPRSLAARYGLNEKTVAKWRHRIFTADEPMGPHKPRSSKLSEVDEAAVDELRRRTLLPLDDILGCLRQTIPQLSRSALHRCLVRHGIQPAFVHKVCPPAREIARLANSGRFDVVVMGSHGRGAQG